MAIGTFGDVVFEASLKTELKLVGDEYKEVLTPTIRTFSGLSFSRSARFAQHDVYMSKPVIDYLGEGSTTASLSIRLDAAHGISPMSELNKLRNLMETADANDLIIGNEPLGMFVVESINEEFLSIDGRGRLLVASCTLTLREANE